MRPTKSVTRARFSGLSPGLDGPRALAPRQASANSAISGPLPCSARPLPAGLAPGTSASGRHPDRVPVRAHQRGPGGLVNAAAGDQDEVAGRTAPPPVRLAQEALGPGSLNGASDLPARHHSEPGRCAAVAPRQPYCHHVRGNTARTGGHHRAELRGPPNPLIPR